MPDPLAILSLSFGETLALAIIIIIAGIVRGFSGFALSAIVMAAAVAFLPPIELIPFLWFQEMAASLLMARGGWRDANRTQAVLLVVGSWIGWPIGLALTIWLAIAQSKLVALAVILALVMLQLARVRLPCLSTKIGTSLAGIVAGIVSGLANVGGMVVALYVLAQGDAARSMRGTLVVFLFASSLGSFFVQIGFGVMDAVSILRGLVFVPLTLVSVWLGTFLFVPKWEPYYRPVCLSLLAALAMIGLFRTWAGL